jgi:hypothetical protein
MPSVFEVAIPTILPSGEEAIWSHWLSTTTAADALLGANAFMTSLSTAANFGARFTSSTQFQNAKISEVDQATGTVLTTQFGTVAFSGTGLGSPLPPQVATVVTLRTGSALRTQVGRYYLPAQVVSDVVSTGRMNATTMGQLATVLQTAHQAEVTAMGAGSVIVYSRKLRSDAVVTTLQIGDVFDTQRRRRDKLAETRTSRTL